MNYISLYRKYRPKIFNDVIGQDFVVQILKNSIKKQKIANAYIFAGVKGTGKTSIAKIYANAINCLNNENGDCCQKCEICNDFAKSQVIDVIELDGASNNGVEEIRKIIDASLTLPTKLKKKVYIIDEAHMLTIQAWNALLKIVEEPPKHVIFIFATTEMHKIPSTILSRCQCLLFNKISNQNIIKLLEKICKKENFIYDLEALKIITNIADGSARDALSILEQVATYSNENINAKDVYQIYGIINTNQIIDFLNLISNGNSSRAIETIDQYFANGINFPNFINLLLMILTDKLIYLKTNNCDLLNKTNKESINSLKINDINVLNNLIDVWQNAYLNINNLTDIKIIIEHCLLKSLSLFTQTKVDIPQLKKKENIKPIPQQNIKNNIDEIEKQDEEDLFETEEIILNNKSNKTNNMPTQLDILFSSISNRDKQKEKEAIQFLEQIKTGILNEKSFNTISLAKKVIFASENCIVLVFDDELDAQLLNKKAIHEDFILDCCKIFQNPKYIIGFSIKQINSLKDQIKNAMKQHNPKLSLEPLRTILNKEKSIEQIAFNTLINNEK